METVECTAWVLVDEDGDYVIAKLAENLKELYEEEYTELGSQQTRLMQVTIRVTRPRPVQVEVDVPDLPSEATVKAA